jgi:hypothetical protein
VLLEHKKNSRLSKHRHLAFTHRRDPAGMKNSGQLHNLQNVATKRLPNDVHVVNGQLHPKTVPQKNARCRKRW